MRSLSSGIIPVFQDIFQSVFTTGQNSFIVHLNRNDVESTRPSTLNRIHVTELLDQQTLSLLDGSYTFCPVVGECLQCLGEPIRITAAKNNLRSAMVGDVWVQMVSCELSNERAKRRVTLGSSVLQRSGKIDLTQEIWLA